MKTPAQRQRCGVSSSYLGSPRPSLTSLVAQMVKHPPTMWETWFQSLAWEGLQEERKWQPTPVFLPGKSHGQRSLVGYSTWGRKESDTTE